MTIPNDLVEKFNNGDQQAFRSIYNIYWSIIYTACLRYLKNAEEAQEITADAFVKLWNCKNEFETLDNIKAWLYTTAKNECINELKRRQRFRSKLKLFFYWNSAHNDSLHEFVTDLDEIKAEVLNQLYSDIEDLPQQCRQIVKMAFVENLKNDEIARQMDLTVQTVKNQKSSAIKRLRNSITTTKKNPILLLFLLIIQWG